MLGRGRLLLQATRTLRMTKPDGSVEKTIQQMVSSPSLISGYPNLAADKYDSRFVETQELETRIMKVIYRLGLRVDLAALDWEQDFRKMGLDSLEHTMLVTSVEHEFKTVFDDNAFSNMNSLNAMVRALLKNHKIL